MDHIELLKKARESRKVNNLICVYCGKQFQSIGHKHAKFCNVKCQQNWHYHNKRKFKINIPKESSEPVINWQISGD
jgi:tRNA(Ile2) C34 agmatinyltransferase TiaS